MLTAHGFRFRPCLFLSFIISACISTVAQSPANQLPVKRNNFYLGPLPAVYQHWLDEDVRWIITDEDARNI